MNRDDDFIGQLEDYLETFDGVTPLPARVKDAIHAELPRTHQVRPAAGLGRIVDMLPLASAPARWGAAAAVVVAVVVLGAAFVNNGNGPPGVGAATPSPSPSPTPTLLPATALTGASPVPCEAGAEALCMPPGTYTLTPGAWPAQVTFDVPAGWFPYHPAPDAEGILVESGLDAVAGSGWGLMFLTVGSVPKSVCDPTAGVFAPAETATVDGLVAAMRAWPGVESSTPTPIVVDGHDGQLLEISSDLTIADCPAAALWSTATGSAVDTYPFITGDTTPHVAQFRIIDVGGKLLVIRTTDFPEVSPFEAQNGLAPDPVRHAGDQVELRQILDSIRVTDAP